MLNKLTFKDNFAQIKLAEYLFNIGFNSYQESGKLAKLVKESIFVSSKNKFQVLFVNWKVIFWYKCRFFHSLIK